MDTNVHPESAAFGQFVVDFGKRSLTRIDESGEHTPIPLGSRAFDILALLVANAGELVSKTEILQAVWPGLAVEDANLTVQISALRRALGPDAAPLIQTVPGRGYRLASKVTAPIEDTARSIPAPVVTDTPQPSSRPSRSHRHILVTASIIACVCLAATAALLHIFHTRSPPRLSVAVLPFATPAEPPQSLASLGFWLPQNLTTDLHQLWAMPVTAPQATARYSTRIFDAKDLGKALNVRYLIEGSLYTAHDHLVVHVDLVSAETGEDLWTDQTDWPSSDGPTTQNRIGSWLQNAVGNAVLRIEAARSRREHPDDPNAADLSLQGRALAHLPSSRERLQAARSDLENAVQMDPTDYLTMSALVDAIITNETDLADGVSGPDLRYAEQLLTKAETIAPTDASVMRSRGYLLRLEQRWPEASAAFEHVLRLYPHAYLAAFELGVCKLHTGEPADAIPLFEDAVATSAGQGDLFSRYIRLGEAFLFAGRYDEAIPWLRKAEIVDPERTANARAEPYLLTASALALSGHLDAARADVAQGLAIFPYTSANSFWATIGPEAHIPELDSIRHALTLAGLPTYISETGPGSSEPAGLPTQSAGLTPAEIRGGHVIATQALAKRLDTAKLVVIDAENGQVSLPHAVSFTWIGRGGAITDDIQPEFARLLAKLTEGDKTRPVVTLGLNADRWAGYNLARRAVALGYTQVFWYRGGRDAWAAAGLPMEKLAPTPTSLIPTGSRP
jgi:adenylate cyclase